MARARIELASRRFLVLFGGFAPVRSGALPYGALFTNWVEKVFSEVHIQNGA